MYLHTNWIKLLSFLSLFESVERVLMCTKDPPHPPKRHCLPSLLLLRSFCSFAGILLQAGRAPLVLFQSVDSTCPCDFSTPSRAQQSILGFFVLLRSALFGAFLTAIFLAAFSAAASLHLLSFNLVIADLPPKA